MSDTIIYNDGELELKVSLESETVWLSRNQLSNLFDRDVKTIGKHISNVFKEGEALKNSTVANFEIVQKEGDREVSREIEHYNLDVIISVGYRVKSKKGVLFRKWATSVLKDYITNGYAINKEKLTQQRLQYIENELSHIKSHIKDNILEIKQGIFYNGQIFDAYVFISDLIKSSKKSIVLIDNYIDDTTLTLFSKNTDIKIDIYTQTISKQLRLDIEKYNKQYKNSSVKTTKNYHDRFMIIDEERVFHIGASLKDLGNKTFAFTSINLDSGHILAGL